MKFIIQIFLISNICLCQTNIYNRIVVDSETLIPLSNVHIHNKIDNTISNGDGLFTFYSTIDDVVFSHLGYEVLNTTVSEVLARDTIFMKPKQIELNEVIVFDNRNLIRSVYNKINENYPIFRFEEEAFIRCVLRKDREIIKFQDLVVHKQQNSLFTTQQIKSLQYSFEIINLRKAGLLIKDSEDFELLSLHDLHTWFSAVFTNPIYYNYVEDSWIDENHLKLNFFKNEKLQENTSLDGYYIINTLDLSIKQVKYKTVYANINLIPFNNKSKVKWRTIGNEIFVDYKRDISTNKYYINNAVLKTIVEVINNGKKSLYEVNYQFFNIKLTDNSIVKSNVSSTINMFKIDFQFNNEFWRNQNQLVLDYELSQFINSLNNLNRKQFKIYSNF